MIIHLPLWKKTRHKKTERIYLRIELVTGRSWGSGGRFPDGSLRIYRIGRYVYSDISITWGRVDWSIFEDNY